jgi:hypothetical protein
MSLFIDIAYDSINKNGEELCGDKVNIVKLEDSTIIVLSDGLGSGVKANILASLTSKIAGTMLREGADIFETVDTIVNTLPICKVRNIAYSTFTIIKVYNDGRTYIAEYDNPPIFLIRNNRSIKIPKKEVEINGKKVNESNIVLQEGDVLAVVSDGAIHAGVGNVLNLGWTWESIEKYLERSIHTKKCAKNISKDLIETCWDLYGGRPGDDTTVAAVKVRESEYIDLFTGPPENPDKDSYVIEQLLKGQGKKIICGGTAANIAQRELHRKMTVNLDYSNSDVPPTATMEGIDLITEGVLTLNKAIEKINRYCSSGLNNEEHNIDGKDGASQLARMLIEQCTHINLWVGKAINPAHQNLDLPIDLNIKLNLVEKLCELLTKLGKCVNITYI